MQLKICGLKYEDNIKQVAAMQPDYAGFIFYKKSARYVGNDFSAKVIENIPKNIKKVGVFVNAPLQEIMIGIDVNSKFESKPGFKNINQLQSLINILKIK